MTSKKCANIKLNKYIYLWDLFLYREYLIFTILWVQTTVTPMQCLLALQGRTIFKNPWQFGEKKFCLKNFIFQFSMVFISIKSSKVHYYWCRPQIHWKLINHHFLREKKFSNFLGFLKMFLLCKTRRPWSDAFLLQYFFIFLGLPAYTITTTTSVNVNKSDENRVG